MSNKLFPFVYLMVLATFFLSPALAQQADLFWLRGWNMEQTSDKQVAFVSMSDKYRLSEHPDSSAIPDLIALYGDEYIQVEQLVLDSIYRERFMIGTGTSEKDKVFIYTYVTNKLITLPVSELTVVANMNVYGADWPYSQYDFMLGFEINKQALQGLEDLHFEHTLVYVGKKSPFVLNKLKQVEWKEVDEAAFPELEPLNYDTTYTGRCILNQTYAFEDKGMTYFLQEMTRVSDNFNALNRLLVIDVKTQKVICDKLIYAGESASFAPLDQQWTGELLKKKDPVIFGFQWHSFGCPFITFLNPKAEDLYIKCDNRH